MMPAEKADPRVQLCGVWKYFGHVEALRGMDLEVLPGEIMALVGDNGAGKSTVVNILSGVHTADSGDIIVDGAKVVFQHPQDAAHLGIETVYQDLALCDNLDVAANLFLGRELRAPARGPLAHFLANRKMAKDAEKVLADLKVTLPSLNVPIAALSGGQRQAVAVGRAILWGSRVVILDEPTAALGVQQTANVYELVRQLKGRGVSVILITHNMVDVFELADRITVIRLGQRAGVFDPRSASSADVVAAITGSNLLQANGD